jgi:hypothetical protein
VIRWAARAIPWPRVIPAACLVLLLMELVRRQPHSTWALEGGAVGLVAGAAAWSLDEPAASVVDTSPRSLAWRTCARLPAVGLLLAAWALGTFRCWPSLGGHGPVVLLQGFAAVAVASGWATWRRAGGVAMPGTVFAAGVVPAALAWGLTPTSEWIPLFPHVAAQSSDWAASARGWSIGGCLALVALAAALADARWWPVRRPRGARSSALEPPCMATVIDTAEDRSADQTDCATALEWKGEPKALTSRVPRREDGPAHWMPEGTRAAARAPTSGHHHPDGRTLKA